jgi:hypothetical protein
MRKRKKRSRAQYSELDLIVLRIHSKAKTPTVEVAKLMKRSIGSLQQKCRRLGIPLGHRPYGKKKATTKKPSSLPKKRLRAARAAMPERAAR